MCKKISYKNFNFETQNCCSFSNFNLFCCCWVFLIHSLLSHTSSLYSAISSQTSSVFQPPPLVRLYGFLSKKKNYSSCKQLLISRECVPWKNHCLPKRQLLSKAGVVWPHYGGNHQRTEVSNRLQNVVINLWTFHPAFRENTAQDILLLLWYRILNSIRSIFHTANLQSNAWETHILSKIPDLCYPQRLKRILKGWRENQEYHEIFSSLSNIPFIH